MRFLLFCEGPTESNALPAFLKKWLDVQLSQPIRITPVEFQGWGDLYRRIEKKAHLRLRDKDLTVISLLDLYGPSFYPEDKTTASDRYEWGKRHIENKVGHDRFHQFFAVHEIEAWLLSDPKLFPREIRSSLPESASNPETVNFNEPPAKLLNRLYRIRARRSYKKRTQGKELFDRLDPEIAREKCPRLKEMLDEMLRLAKEAGL